MMLTVMPDCFYTGEVVDIYKQALSSHYGSVEDTTFASSLAYLTLRVYLPLQVQTLSYLFMTISDCLQAPTTESDDDMEEDVPTFTGRHNGHKLHTHTPASHLVYHFGAPREL